ncbi:MAG: hypothetical protein EVJ46_06300 [Candidatus Acididesulfobacter guangdongensis]|uniref:Uncharacterized protein n=1 Tax=Acididesulfobacter guangdongensis TaxID=2597225 RepID=A0A519BH67_ACIG2|nr:MAG: hypothetical protein EVJ46_06300 [Candidatus Acididesulfobacter guangdongensis]
MLKKFKKISVFIVIMTLSMYLSLSLANTRRAYALAVPSISGVVNAASSLADAGNALVQAGNTIGMVLPPVGPFGLATSVNQFLSGKFKSLMNMGKAMQSLAKLQVALSKVQSSINAATNAVTDVYNAEGDITNAKDSLLSQGITLNNCSGGQGVMGSVAAEQCTDDSINNNIAELQGTYSDLGGQAGISGNGISSALAGSSLNQSALLSGASNFQYISENGLAGSVAISPASNLCQDEIAAGIVSNSSQCTESYKRAMNSQLNDNLFVDSTKGIAAGNSMIATGSGFSKNVSNISGSYDLQQVELLKMLAEENAQQIKATGELTKQIAVANQTKAAKKINNSTVPGVSKLPEPPSTFIY